MNLFQKLFGKKENIESLSDEEIVTIGLCPNCWGHQEYGGKFKEYLEDYTRANITHDKSRKKAFIQQFVETNITGIRLKQEATHQICPKCQTKYKAN